MKNTILTITILISASFMISCGSVDSGSSDGSSNNPTLDPTSSPLYIQVTKGYEGTSSIGDYVGDCFVNATDPHGTNNTCEIKIPELTLYYSDLKFTIGTSSAVTCAAISFRPYFFKLSNNNPYPGVGGIDCSGTGTAACYGGAAPNIISTFPLNSGIYFLPAQGLSMDFDLESTNSRRATENTIATQSNVGAANSLAVRNLDINNAEIDYVGGSMRDYEVSCRDPWANELYSLTLIIRDEDSQEAPVVDEFYDWNDGI